MLYRHKQKIFSLALVLFVLVVVIVCAAIVHSAFELLGAGGYTMATMAAIGNIDGISDRYTAGSQLSAKLWLVHVDSQLDSSVAFPRPNAARELGTIPLKPGQYMHYFTAIDDTLSDNSKGDKGDVTTNVTNTFSFTMGGNRDQLLNFIEEYAGGRFILIYQICSEGSYFIMGTPCKPMILKSFERKNDKDSRSVVFTFENKAFEQPYKYKGDIVQGAPGTITVDATVLAVQASKGSYYTPDTNTVAKTLATVTGLGAADKGRIIDIIGTGGAFPLKIAANTTFILTDKQDWIANAGSRISFKVMDATTLIEQEGSRVQTA